MRILIVGGTGYVSSGVVEAALAAQHDVSILTRGRRPLANNWPVTALTADRNNPAELEEALAGHAFDAAIDTVCMNGQQAQDLAAALAGRCGRLAMISTDFVYSTADRPNPVTEQTPRAPISSYATGKIDAEDAVLSPHSPIPSTALRPPHVVGAGGLLGTGSLQGRDSALLARLRRAEPIILLDDGTLLIQPADRLDIGAACLAAVASPNTIGKAYNIVGPRAVTTRTYYQIVADYLGVPLTVLSLSSSVYLAAFPDRVSFAVHRAYVMDALARDANFRPTISLEQSLHAMVAWLDVNPPAGHDAQASEKEKNLINLLRSGVDQTIALLRS